MTTTLGTPMEELEASECWALLRDAKVGRLAIAIAGHPDIFPINYIVDEHHDHGRSIVFRTAPVRHMSSFVSPTSWEGTEM